MTSGCTRATEPGVSAVVNRSPPADDPSLYATESMSLAIPINIATRDSQTDFLPNLLASLPGPLTYHVCDGRFATHAILQSELDDATTRVGECSIQYVLDGSRGGLREPIAGFIANESLGIAKLQHLIDDHPPAAEPSIPRRTSEMLGVYIRSLFADFGWLNAVTVPSSVQLLDGLFQLTVESSDISRVALADIAHRPKSSRNGA